MKFTNILIATVTIASLSSCSTINRILKKDNTSSPRTESNATTKKDMQNETSEAAAENEGQLSSRLAGEWIIISAGGKAIDISDEMPYLTFEKASGRFYASNSCNVLNGSYVLDGTTITFDNVLSTMKMCPETEYEAPISTALSGAQPVTASINNLGHESFLTLIDSKGIDLLKARRHNMEFLNGNWQITSVAGKKNTGDEATLFIDIAELKVHGNTGCNFFNGQLFINPDKTNAIDFSNLATTRMACPNMEQESAILLALEDAVSAIQGSEGTVMLLNTTGQELMTLKPLPIQAED